MTLALDRIAAIHAIISDSVSHGGKTTADVGSVVLEASA